jgi:hypothetical protein
MIAIAAAAASLLADVMLARHRTITRSFEAEVPGVDSCQPGTSTYVGAAPDHKQLSYGASMLRPGRSIPHRAARMPPKYSAISDLTSAVPGLQVVRIEPDELVTTASIAKRSGLSREYIRLLSTNQRGPGGFPAPVTYADHKTRLWHWPDVAHWLTEHEKAKINVDAHAADLVAAMNAAFDLREHASQLHDKHDLALVSQALGAHSRPQGPNVGRI